MISLNEFNANQAEYRLWEKKEDSTLIYFYPASDKKSNGAVIIFAGGGYMRKAEFEGKGYAQFLNENGINAFVVDYRVSPNIFPAQLVDARRAVRFVRYYSEKFGIDASKIAVMGSSAGGHLAALVSTYRDKIDCEGVDEIDNEDYIPNLQILCYPVINLSDEAIRHEGSAINLLGKDNLDFVKNVSPDLIADEKTPRAFIWHTATDGAVNVINSYNYAGALRRHKIPVELHVFPAGDHGLGLGHGNQYADAYPVELQNHVSQWNALLFNFLRFIGFLNK